MSPDDTLEWFDLPPAPLEPSHRQALKNRDYALAGLALLPAREAEPLRTKLDTLVRGLEEAYETGDAVAHYRLERQLFFQFMMKLSFSLQALKNESSATE